MSIGIREIKGDEWRLWRSLRLRAVEESPDAFRGTLAEESAEADERWRELIAKTARHPDALLLVAEVDSDPVGMLFGRLDDDKDVLDLGAMWVDPEVRRQGIGRGLVRSAIEWARTAGANRAELWLTHGNEAAERLYEAAGFATAGEVEPLREGSKLTVARMAAQI